MSGGPGVRAHAAEGDAAARLAPGVEMRLGLWRSGLVLGGYVRAHPGCDVSRVAAALGQPSAQVADALTRFSRSEALRCIDGSWWPARPAGGR